MAPSQPCTRSCLQTRLLACLAVPGIARPRRWHAHEQEGANLDGARGQFEQLMDPNVLARFVVPRPLNNFLDNLPSEERLAADGPWTLVEPTSKLLKEVRVPSCVSALLASARPLLSLNAGPGHSTQPPTPQHPALSTVCKSGSKQRRQCTRTRMSECS